MTKCLNTTPSVVWLVMEDTRAYRFEDRITNEEMVAAHGWPRQEAWSRGYERRHLKYCDQGVMFATDGVMAENVFYFMPVKVCSDEFELYLTSDPPEPRD